MSFSSVLAALALVAGECPTKEAVSTVNRPIATAQLPEGISAERAEKAVRRFAKNRHFAIQQVIAAPKGMLEFATMLFRDDISVSISKLRGEPIEMFAYPLCACEADRQFGLKEAADAAVTEMRSELLRR